MSLQLPFVDDGSEDWMNNAVYESICHLDIRYTLHRREPYGILSLMGELGGVMEILIWLLGLFMYPICRFRFNI